MTCVNQVNFSKYLYVCYIWKTKLPPYVILFLDTSTFSMLQLEANGIFLRVVESAVSGVIWECGISERQMIFSEHSGY